jgi:guanyl-specific ribonuclease Sa
MHFSKISRDELPKGLREPIRDLRYSITSGNPTVFSNNEGLLPPAGRGNTYYEHDVGEDRTGGRGRFRVVALVSAGGELLAMYFTSAHYQGEWTEIAW